MTDKQMLTRFDGIKEQVAAALQQYGDNAFLRRATAEAADDEVILAGAMDTALESARVRGYVAGYLQGRQDERESRKRGGGARLSAEFCGKLRESRKRGGGG